MRWLQVLTVALCCQNWYCCCCCVEKMLITVKPVFSHALYFASLASSRK